MAPARRPARQAAAVAARQADGDPPPGPVRKLLRSPLAWTAGVTSAVVAGGLIAWLPGGGRDLVDRVADSGPLLVPLVMQGTDGDAAVARRIDDPADLLTDLSGFPALVAKYGGGAVGRLDVTLVAEGGRGRMRVVDLRPRIARRLPLLTAAYFRPASGGQPDVIHLSADLDAADPRFRFPDKPGALYFTKKQIELRRGEQETLLLTFQAREAAYEFDLVATVVADGRTYQQVIRPPGGGRFRITGAADDYRRYGRVYVGGDSRWRPAGREDKCAIFPRSKGC